MKLRSFRIVLFWTALLAATALLASLYGPRLEARVRVEEVEAELDDALKTFTALLSLVEENHATKVEADTAVYGAIDGMLRTLDPHSKFFTPAAFTELREGQQGRYYGLGITVSSRFGKVTVVSPPFPGAPAEKVGLRVGDVISHVNGEATEGSDLNSVVGKLKGPRGTPVDVTIARPGVDEPLEITIVRDEIARFTISSAFHIRDGIGYVKLDSFAETTGTELRAALRDLRDEELNGLIFDLRGNPGGLLQQAIDVSETFLQKDQAIVETRGRTSGSNRPYASQRDNKDNLYPLVVVINRQSASASEIVAGAIQDHDRGLIVGETSFGKGLVQSVFPLNKQAGLALTTQKWYTPSGRLIQRDYSMISEFDYYNQRGTPPAPSEDDIQHSDLGRTLYGGGGIIPDEMISMSELNESQDLMDKRFVFYTYAQDYLQNNPTIDPSFEVSGEIIDDFIAHLRERDIEITEAAVEENLDFVALKIKYEIFYSRFGVAEATRVLLQGDEQILAALELIPEAADLAARARGEVARRR
jgi:carboxyl-terminal processing protease